MPVRILVVDDNADILANVGEYLRCQGWDTGTCRDGAEALERLARESWDLLILDLGLPGLDGMSVCRRLRSQGNSMPILMLTARDTVDDRVEGLTAGADDYLVKPFSLRELAARVEALLRRSIGKDAEVLAVGPLSMNLRTMKVTRDGKDIRLNPTGMTLLKELLRASPAVLPRERLEAVVWGGDAPASDSLRSNLYLLRQAIDKPFKGKMLRTHPGLGWSIEPPDESETSGGSD